MENRESLNTQCRDGANMPITLTTRNSSQLSNAVTPTSQLLSQCSLLTEISLQQLPVIGISEMISRNRVPSCSNICIIKYKANTWWIKSSIKNQGDFYVIGQQCFFSWWAEQAYLLILAVPTSDISIQRYHTCRNVFMWVLIYIWCQVGSACQKFT